MTLANFLILRADLIFAMDIKDALFVGKLILQAKKECTVNQLHSLLNDILF